MEKLLKEWNPVTLRDHLVNRKANTKHVADGFQPILPVTAIPFETLRIGRGRREFSQVAKADDPLEHDCRLALTQKPPPQSDSLGPAHHLQQLRPPGEISIKDPPRNFDEDCVFRQPQVAELSGRIESRLAGAAGQQLRLKFGIQKCARFAAFLRTDEEPPGKAVNRRSVTGIAGRIRQRRICLGNQSG
jgi:hypothetical protein